MDRLSRFDVATFRDVRVVIVESDLLPADPAVVVVPLLPDYPAIRHLNPEILHHGTRLILATRLIAAVRRTALRREGSVADQADRITRAVDVLMAGV